MTGRLRDITQKLSGAPRAGLTAARYVQCLAQPGGNYGAVRYAENQKHWTDREQILFSIKAAVEAMDRDSIEAATSSVGADLVAAAAPLSIPGQMLGVIQPAPFRTRMILNSTPPTAQFVGEGQAIPVSAMSFDAQGSLDPRKVAGISVLTQELARSSSPAAESFVATELSNATAKAISAAFIDVSNAGSSDIRPASVTSQGTLRASTGTSVAAISNDLEYLAGVVGGSSDSDLSGTFWVMHPVTLAHLAFLRDGNNGPAFPGTGIRGSLAGIPIISSTACINANSPAERQISLIDARQVLLAWSESATIELGGEAMLEMDGVPDNPTNAGSVMTSMWQANLIAAKATQYANWKLRRSAACCTLTDVMY